MNLKSLLKNIVVSILLLVFVIDLNLIIFVITMNETLLNPEFVINELDKTGFYSSVRNSIVNEVNSSSPELLEIVNKSISELMVREEINALIYNAYSYIRHEDTKLNLTVSLVDIKSKIKDNIKATEPQIPDAMINVLLANIPDIIDLEEQMDEGQIKFIEKSRSFLYYYYTFSSFLYFVAIMLIILLLLIMRDIVIFMKKTGFSLLMSGALSYGFPIMIIEMISGNIEGIEFPSEFPREVLANLISDLFAPSMRYGIAIAVLGFILLILAFFIEHLRREKEPEKGER